MNPLRSLILLAADNEALRHVISSAPGTRGIVGRFVAGNAQADAVAAVRWLANNGMYTTLDYLGEHTVDSTTSEDTVQAYLRLLDELHANGLSGYAEVSIKLSAVGAQFDHQLALNNAYRICAVAEQCGTTVTLDMEDHSTTDATLAALVELRRTWSSVGAVLQSYLHRTEGDSAALAVPGSRVRLCKGAYAEPTSVAYGSAHEVDLSYLRCANNLLAGDGYPMFATHDPRLLEIVAERIRWYGRKQGGYEYQMLYGIRPEEQRRLVEAGETVRVYVPFGRQWYGYLMRRLAERPANVAFFLRALASRS